MELEFQIICVDTSSKVKVKSELNLIHLILSNGDLWKNPELKKKVISETDKSLSCRVRKIESSSKDDTNPQASFIISLKGKYENIEPSRIKLLEFISNQNFDHSYVIKDDVSKKIACELYPFINELETLLRGYLMKFFITKLGVKWWDITADSEMKQKAIKRKNNEKIFSNYIDNKVYLIDFGELGKMVYALSSGYINKDDILNKLLTIEESIDALKELKNELQSNYNKFFKDTFKDKQFQKKWESIEKLRHKVAHNNLFVQEDLMRGKKDCEELIKIIEEANKAMEQINFTEEEKEMIVESSLSNINELYGDFIKSWKVFVGELSRLVNQNGGNANAQYGSPKRLFLFLSDKKVVDNTEYKIIKDLINFRNELVHKPNDEWIDAELPQAILALQEIIKKLKEK